MLYKVKNTANPLLFKHKGSSILFLHNILNYNVICKIILLFPALFTVISATANSPQITIVWSTENYDQNAAILSDSSDVPLSSGIQGNGDGDLVEIGYYALATTDNPFAGEWIALSQNTRVGDSSTGYGFDDGKFAFTSTFTKDENTVTIFPTEPKVFVETLNFTITSTSPPQEPPFASGFMTVQIKRLIPNIMQLLEPIGDGPVSLPARPYLQITTGRSLLEPLLLDHSGNMGIF